jgi:hypothetical protein
MVVWCLFSDGGSGIKGRKLGVVVIELWWNMVVWCSFK